MKDKITKFLVIGILTLFLALSTASCGLLHEVFEDTYVTTSDNIKPEARDLVVPAPLDKLDPETRAKLTEDGKVPVIGKKEDLIDVSKGVELTAGNSNSLGNLLDIGVGVANAIWPGVAAVEGLGLLLSRRKRTLYVDAVKSVNPLDGTGQVDLKDAVVNVVRAMGFAHSSNLNKEIFNDDHKKVS